MTTQDKVEIMRIKTGHTHLLYNGTVAKGDFIWLDKEGIGNTPLSFFINDINPTTTCIEVKEATEDFVVLSFYGVEMKLTMSMFVRIISKCEDYISPEEPLFSFTAV